MKNVNKSIDSFEKFGKFFAISPSKYAEWAIEEIEDFYNEEIYKTINKSWTKLKSKINNENEIVYIRVASLNKRSKEEKLKASNKYKKLYKDIDLVKCDIFPDSNGNKQPQTLLGQITGYYMGNRNSNKSNSKKLVLNYKASHIWGYTDNPYLFTAPWNVIWTPTIVDSLTGRDSQGEFKLAFRKAFKNSNHYKNIKPYVNEYNKIAKNVREQILSAKIDKNTKENLLSQWQELTINNIFEAERRK